MKAIEWLGDKNYTVDTFPVDYVKGTPFIMRSIASSLGAGNEYTTEVTDLIINICMQEHSNMLFNMQSSRAFKNVTENAVDGIQLGNNIFKMVISLGGALRPFLLDNAPGKIMNLETEMDMFEHIEKWLYTAEGIDAQEMAFFKGIGSQVVNPEIYDAFMDAHLLTVINRLYEFKNLSILDLNSKVLTVHHTELKVLPQYNDNDDMLGELMYVDGVLTSEKQKRITLTAFDYLNIQLPLFESLIKYKKYKKLISSFSIDTAFFMKDMISVSHYKHMINKVIPFRLSDNTISREEAIVLLKVEWESFIINNNRKTFFVSDIINSLINLLNDTEEDYKVIALFLRLYDRYNNSLFISFREDAFLNSKIAVFKSVVEKISNNIKIIEIDEETDFYRIQREVDVLDKPLFSKDENKILTSLYSLR